MEEMRKVYRELFLSRVKPTPDRPSDPEALPEPYRSRREEIVKHHHLSVGIDHNNKEQAKQYTLRGLSFFGATNGIIIYTDSSLMSPSMPFPIFDIGGVVQTIALLAHNYGLGCCIQGQMVNYPDIIRQLMNIPASKTIVVGLSIGYPDMDVFILYRDLRSYGLREDLYREARARGINFIRHDFDKGLDVTAEGTDLRVRFTDTILRRRMEIRPDIVVLATAITPPKENPLAQQYKVTLNDDGFFMEAHVKLRPVDCATDGVFICGLAHAPKPLDESVAQAQAAATRAITLLAKKTIQMSGTVAHTDSMSCSSCGVCVALCPYSAPSFIQKGPFTGKAEINPVLCKGCGLCVASCRSGAIHLRGFDNDQIFAQIFALRETV